MSNTVTSRIEIFSRNGADEQIYEMVKSLSKVSPENETKKIVEHFYDQSEILSEGTNPITESGVDIKWLNKWVGSKWISIYFDEDIKVESAHVPNGFTIKLWDLASKIDSDVEVVCKWTDESQAGTILIKNGFASESYENISEDIDSDELWETIHEIQSDRYDSCEEALDTQDFDFPNVKLYKVANKKWEVLSPSQW